MTVSVFRFLLASAILAALPICNLKARDRVANRAELEKAAALFEEHGIEHGEVRDLPPFGITILSFSDPDGIQCELTAPLE